MRDLIVLSENLPASLLQAAFLVYSKVEKHVDSRELSETILPAAGEDCILASLEGLT